MTGLSSAAANAQAAPAPTNSAPANPGPRVKATTSTSSKLRPACSSTWRVKGTTRRMWSRLASSGTTPPKAWCISTWL